MVLNVLFLSCGIHICITYLETDEYDTSYIIKVLTHVN